MLSFKEDNDDIPPKSHFTFIQDEEDNDNQQEDVSQLHAFEESQIRKIISDRYNNDPINLIRQLLKDLQNKQNELLRLKEEMGDESDDDDDEFILDNELESIKNWDNDNNENTTNTKEDSFENYSIIENSQELPLELQSIKRKKSKLIILPIYNHQDLEIDKYGFIKKIRKPSTSRILSENKSRNKNNRCHDNDDSSSESIGILINENNESRLISQLKQISQIHDDANLYFDKKWDILIKDIKYYFMFDNNTSRNKQDIPSLGIRGVNLNHYYFPFVNLINQFGIPLRYRYLWLDLSGSNDIRINGEYQELVTIDKTTITPKIKKFIEEIELDLHRTLPSNYYFNNIFEFKPGVYFYKLQRILYAFVKKFPNIGYVQGMNKIIGTLLLGITDGDEEDVFWLFISLIEEILPKYNESTSFFNSISQIHQENVKLKDLLLLIIPDLYKHFIKLDVEIELITMNWWLTLFIDLKLINLDDWFKIFDNLLIGDQFLFLPCFTLSILKTLESSLLKLQSNDEIYKFLNMNSYQDNNNHHVDHHDDINIGFGIQYNLKFHELMKHYLNYSRRKEISDVFLNPVT